MNKEILAGIQERGLNLLDEMRQHLANKYPGLPIPPIVEEVVIDTTTQGPAIVGVYDHFLALQELEEMPIALLRASSAVGLPVVIAHGEGSLLLESRAIYVQWGLREREGRWEVVYYEHPLLAGYVRLSPFDLFLEWRDLFQRGIPGIFNQKFEEATMDKFASLEFFAKAKAPCPETAHFRMSLRRVENRDEKVKARLVEMEAKGIFTTGAVVKPVGSSLGMGVVMFPEGVRVEEIAVDILARNHDVIVQRRINPPPLVIEGEDFDWNFRVLVARNSLNEPAVVAIEIRYSSKGGVVNAAQGAKRLTFEDFISRMGWDLTKVRQAIEALSLSMFRAIEDGLGLVDPQQDAVGLDIIVDHDRKAYAMEINGSLAMGYLGLDELQPDASSSALSLLKLMELRARVYVHNRVHLLVYQPEVVGEGG
ncbi:MAG: hypothetical protein Q8P13_02030 [bacterium]|nr:hypothetical protein [bacterium]